jgi:Flp pilus assembly CpaF family ATPase
MSLELTQLVNVVSRRLPDEVDALVRNGHRLDTSDERVLAVRLAADEVPTLDAVRLRKGLPRFTAEEIDVMTEALLARLFGLAGLQVYVDDPAVESIDANGHDNVFVTYADGRCENVPPVAGSEVEFIDVIKAAARRLGLGERRWDTTEPVLFLQLPDGSRLTAVLGGATERGMAPVPIVSIRRHRYSDLELSDLVGFNAISEHGADFLRAAVLARRTILVSGGTNTGKTTLLRALCHEIPMFERLVTVERDLLELGLHLSPRHPNTVPLHSRQSNVEGEGEVTVAQLVQATLRLNPSRVIVGEVLGDEVVPMLNAMSQGNDGSMCTIHADSSEMTFSRLATYAVQSKERLPAEATSQLVAGAVHFVVFLSGERYADRPMRRFVSSIREVTGLTDTGRVASSEVFGIDDSGRLAPAAGISPTNQRLLQRFGYDPARHVAPWVRSA